MDLETLRNQLIDLMKSGKDTEAIQLLSQEFDNKPLVAENGDDGSLDFVVNPIGLDLLYTGGEYERSVKWWDSVLKVINDYDASHGTHLHKGLVLHNKGLPLIRLNRLDEAVDTIEKAYKEDQLNFPLEATSRQAYLVLSFLKPIVERNLWRKELVDPATIEDLFHAFEELFIALKGEGVQREVEESIKSVIENKELEAILLRRYKIIKNPSQDPLMRIVYAGSVLEGVLGDLLSQKSDESLAAFVNLSKADRSFLFFIELSDASFDAYLKSRTKKKDIKKWDLSQMICVANEISLLRDRKVAMFYILGNLLRDYRNLIHTSNLEAIGKTQGSTLVFNIDENQANMISAALDMVLVLFGKTEKSIDIGKELIMDSGQHSLPNDFVMPSGVLSSLASPSRVKSEDINNFDPDMTKTISFSTSSSPVMGSSSTTTTTLNLSSVLNKEDKEKENSG